MAVDKILVVGKHPEAQQLIRPYAAQLYAADNAGDIQQFAASVEPDLIIFDAAVPDQTITHTVQTLRENKVNTPVIIIRPQDYKENEQSLRQIGVLDIVFGYEDSGRMGVIIDRLANGNSETDDRFFIDDCPPSVSIVGKSPAIQRSIRMIRLVAQSTCNPILIIGETGTGKELAAQAVHLLRHGSDSKFVAVNCAALTATLLESELFGHVKGAFTSADRDKTGLLELAGNGTIFLDEISEMQPDLQAKLLRVLQEKTFRKVGGSEEIECRATIIATSNRNLLKEVELGKFRQDLYYRLSICPIFLSPLRCETRKEDILLLAEFFIRNSTICPEKKGRIKGLTKLAAETLLRHPWPGNVRELRNVIERAILLEASERIGTSTLILNPEHFTQPQTEDAFSVGLKDFSLEKAEKELVKKALEEAGWQKTRAASLLGITRATLYAKVKQYNIQEPVMEQPQPV
jgi:transcriptional regulator with PAS, ATPase and Fis domain